MSFTSPILSSQFLIAINSELYFILNTVYSKYRTVKVEAHDGISVYRQRKGVPMGYIHCCGGLRKTRTFRLLPQGDFVLCETDYLAKCPVCGNLTVQVTRIDKENNISIIKKKNKKALKFFEKLKSNILYEENKINYSKRYTGRFYLNYNEFGVKKRCYSNLRNLKLGLRTLI